MNLYFIVLSINMLGAGIRTINFFSNSKEVSFLGTKRCLLCFLCNIFELSGEIKLLLGCVEVVGGYAYRIHIGG